MTMRENSLPDSDFFRNLLDAREERWHRRLALSELGTVLTLTLNIPGPDKCLPRWLTFFAAVREDILQMLKNADFIVDSALSEFSGIGPAGPEDHFLFRPSSLCDAQTLKRLTAAFEENYPGGRLADLDVMAPGGEVVDRKSLGLSPRGCLCCPRPAKECAARARHSLDEVLKAAQNLLNEVQNLT
ncbi:MAG: citrate lyase holo-[acyl-carrier protein] synthase [Synergistaceae bacterium]|jgi:holo-ACP synthase CitX|nr:citrate lyase holo-[acyl-carrier protein] synthase [Synergistaceae bacterium]